MKPERLVTIFQRLIVFLCVAVVLVIGITSLIQLLSRHEGNAMSVVLPAIILVGLLFLYTNLGWPTLLLSSAGFVGPGAKGTFLSIFATFLVLFLLTVGGLVLAIEYQIPPGLVALVSGGLAGGLLGSWGAATWELSSLYTGLGAFFGLSADAGISYASGTLPKTILGALTQFILESSKAFAGALKDTQLPPPSQPTMSLFLWPFVACVLVAFAIGIYQKRNEVNQLKADLATQRKRAETSETNAEELEARASALQAELTDVRQKATAAGVKL